MMVILFGDVKVVGKQQETIPALHVTLRDHKQDDRYCINCKNSPNRDGSGFR